MVYSSLHHLVHTSNSWSIICAVLHRQYVCGVPTLRAYCTPSLLTCPKGSSSAINVLLLILMNVQLYMCNKNERFLCSVVDLYVQNKWVCIFGAILLVNVF